jgi:hypothetical protein
MANQQNSINIVIAGFTIKLYSESAIELEEGYETFLATENTDRPDVTVQCFAGIPYHLFENKELVFEAKNELQRFYSIYRIGSDLGFIIYNQQKLDEIQQIAVLDETFTHWKVYSETTDDNLILPLKYPLGPIVMHYLTLKTDSVLMHASCAFDGSKARLFTGFSGNGKSTISKLWSEAGNQIINDDRIIIRRHENGYYAYNTPMYYKDISKKAPLGAIYLISHSPGNKIKKLSGALAISKVMAFCIQNNFEKQFIQSRLSFFSDLCTQIPVYDLGFVPDQSVVNFILTNETGGAK